MQLKVYWAVSTGSCVFAKLHHREHNRDLLALADITGDLGSRGEKMVSVEKWCWWVCSGSWDVVVVVVVSESHM